MGNKRTLALTIIVTSVMAWHNVAIAARTADIARTKHNFSAEPEYTGNLANRAPGESTTRVLRATSEPQICVFCHTPHAAETSQGPLWNRALNDPLAYKTYGSSSIDATTKTPGVLDPPNGVSKLCLSCHDGTMAIGAVNVLNGTFTDRNPQTEDIAMRRSAESPTGRIPTGVGATTGFTRFLGTDLTNDHPISVAFDDNLFIRDGEMRLPSAESHIVVRGIDPVRPKVDDIHLEPPVVGTNVVNGGMVQCNSCHDPHIIDDTENYNIKFLRLNRLQKAPAPLSDNAAFNKNTDIICLACHNKAGWAGSAHANEQVADEIYQPGAAKVREFPLGTQVWETACLACHDTHTVEGSRRLLREGTDAPSVPTPDSNNYPVKSGGGRFAIEETCYACHSGNAAIPPRNTLQSVSGQLQGSPGFPVPDVNTDFTTAGNTHMPIASDDQEAGKEVHDIGSSDVASTNPVGLGKDFIENPVLLGGGQFAVGIANPNIRNRHAECTDCHNVHRVIKNRRFNDNPSVPDPAGTHDHSAPHTNIASGVLKGIWGVEPTSYAGSQFMAEPTMFEIKRGNPGVGVSTAVTSTYITREYQVCFKCHSNYAYGSGKLAPPVLGGTNSGGTRPGTNSLFRYTNQAMEYQSDIINHGGEGTSGTPSGSRTDVPGMVTNNHRSWHPVVSNTGRTPSVRNADANNWIAPFNGAVGTQTMYCTDCHGNNTANGTAVPSGGEDGNVWGPHGSSNRFLLKGEWSGNGPTNNDDQTGRPGTGPGQPSHLCFKCHQYNQYANGAGPAQPSGYALGGGMGGCMGGCMGGGGMGSMRNLHVFHNNAVTNFRCNLCHVAVPHGWKNKVFLVNLNDVGEESTTSPPRRGEVRYAAVDGTGGANGAVLPYFDGPYYNRAALKIVSFAISGRWQPSNCGSMGENGNGVTGVAWMAGGGMGGGGMGGGGMGGGGGGGASEACINLP